MEREELKPIVEALIFASESAITLDRLCRILEETERETVKGVLEELMNEYRDPSRGFSLERVAGGYQFRTRPEHAFWIKRLFRTAPQRISRASMETLAIVAYRQPITRGELESLRGVDSGGVLKSLLEKGLIRIVGRKDSPGRPAMYGTTKEFLETFDLRDLSELPSLKEVEMLDVEEEEYALTEASEDNIARGDSVEEKGRGADTAGQGQGEPQDRGGAGHAGRS